MDFNISAEIKHSYIDRSVKKRELYFFVGETYYWELLRDAQSLNYTLGQDIGILAQNDSIEKEISFGGITTLSTNFKEMGIRAAKHIKHNKENTHEVIPTELILRNSI